MFVESRRQYRRTAGEGLVRESCPREVPHLLKVPHMLSTPICCTCFVHFNENIFFLMDNPDEVLKYGIHTIKDIYFLHRSIKELEETQHISQFRKYSRKMFIQPQYKSLRCGKSQETVGKACGKVSKSSHFGDAFSGINFWGHYNKL